MNEIIRRRQERVKDRVAAKKAKEKRIKSAKRIISKIHKMQLLIDIEKWKSTTLCIHPVEKIILFSEKKSYFRRYYIKNKDGVLKQARKRYYENHKREILKEAKKRKLNVLLKDRDKVLKGIESIPAKSRKQERLVYRLAYFNRIISKEEERLRLFYEKEERIAKELNI